MKPANPYVCFSRRTNVWFPAHEWDEAGLCNECGKKQPGISDETRREVQEYQVARWVESRTDYDHIPDSELVRYFRLLYGREPDAIDREQGLWSLICAGLESA